MELMGSIAGIHNDVFAWLKVMQKYPVDDLDAVASHTLLALHCCLVVSPPMYRTHISACGVYTYAVAIFCYEEFLNPDFMEEQTCTKILKAIGDEPITTGKQVLSL